MVMLTNKSHAHTHTQTRQDLRQLSIEWAARQGGNQGCLALTLRHHRGKPMRGKLWCDGNVRKECPLLQVWYEGRAMDQ